VHKEFLCFVPVSSTTGNDLASTILTQLSQLGLNLEHMGGQGYDGASHMSEKYRGVHATIKELYPLAMYTHCCNHVLHFESLCTIYSYFDFGLKNSSFWLPYQRPSSSALCAREMFKGSNGSASLVECTQKNLLVGGADFLWLTSSVK